MTQDILCFLSFSYKINFNVRVEGMQFMNTLSWEFRLTISSIVQYNVLKVNEVIVIGLQSFAKGISSRSYNKLVIFHQFINSLVFVKCLCLVGLHSLQVFNEVQCRWVPYIGNWECITRCSLQDVCKCFINIALWAMNSTAIAKTYDNVAILSTLCICMQSLRIS